MKLNLQKKNGKWIQADTVLSFVDQKAYERAAMMAVCDAIRRIDREKKGRLMMAAMRRSIKITFLSHP